MNIFITYYCNRFLKVILLSVFVFVTNQVVIAQDAPSKSDVPKKDQSIKSKRKQRKADKKEWKEDRKKKKAEEKMIRDHHKRIQTKEVRKRMKRSKKTALRNHDHKRKPLFERMFNRDGKRKHSKKLEKTSQVK
jgi:hypothetical protein